MKMLGICAILYLMIIYGFDVCDAKCDEYIIVFEEITCPRYNLRPQKLREINWDKLTDPCNSTDIYEEILGNKECILEFTCSPSTDSRCNDHVEKRSYQNHSLIAVNNTVDHAGNMSKASDVPKINIIDKEKLYRKEAEDNDTSMYDVNLIYINKNDMQNSSEFNNEKSKTLHENMINWCFAETVCNNAGKAENYNFSDVNNYINVNRRSEPATTLQITINRDENSTIQPIFTGYNSDFTTKVDSTYKYFKTVNLTCTILEDYNNCTPNIGNKSRKQINIYIITNYVQSDTITKYPNCTNDFIASNNSFNIKCDDVHFAKYNQHIILTPQQKNNTPIKFDNKTEQGLLTWNCLVIELNGSLSSKEKHSEIYFNNCSYHLNIDNNKIQTGDHNITPIPGSKKGSIDNIATKYGMAKPINEDINLIKLLITEKANNCSQNSSLNIQEGKIVNISTYNKQEILKNNIVELKLSNCINVNSSIINNTRPHLMADLTIFLKNESINTLDLKLFNETSEKANIKQRIIIRCDLSNHNFTSNTTNTKIILQCESIDLDDYINITHLENGTPLNQTINANHTKEKKKDYVNKIEENYNQTKVEAEVNINNNCSTNKTAAPNECSDNKSNENDTKVIENKEVQNNTKNKEVQNNTENIKVNNNTENKEVQINTENIKVKNNTVPNNTENIKVQNNTENKEVKNNKKRSKKVNFNRRKDIEEGAEQNSLALDLDSGETEKIMLITLAALAGAGIVVALAFRAFPKKQEYNATPTREPPDEEETAF